MRIKGKVRAGRLVGASWLLMALAGGLSLLVASPASAEFYEFTFSGEIVDVDGNVPEPWEDAHVGSVFEFSYVFDSETEDQAGSPFIGQYYIEGGALSIDDVAQPATEAEIRIWNLPPTDNYIVILPDFPIDAYATVQLVGLDVLDSDDLLLDIDLDDWPDKLFKVSGFGYYLAGDANHFERRIVPVPATSFIVIGGMLLSRKRRLRCGADVDIQRG